MDVRGDSEQIARAGNVARDDDELVAARACDRIGCADDAAEPLCDLFEELIAVRMAARVVDVFEAVEIEEEHRHETAVTLRVRHRVFETLVEHRPVRQAGEGVVMGEICETRFRELSLRDVDDRADDARRIAVRVGRELGLLLDVANFARGGDDPVVDAIRLAGLLEGVDCGANRGRIIGMIETTNAVLRRRRKRHVENAIKLGVRAAGDSWGRVARFSFRRLASRLVRLSVDGTVGVFTLPNRTDPGDVDVPYYDNPRINNLDENIAILRSPSKLLM